MAQLQISEKQLTNCLRAAIDRAPVTQAQQDAPAAPGEIERGMRQAVARINHKCDLDLYMVAADGQGKKKDSLGNATLAADVHVYSSRCNSSLTLHIEVLSVPPCTLWITQAQPLSTRDPGSPIKPVTNNVFNMQYARVDPYGNLL